MMMIVMRDAGVVDLMVGMMRGEMREGLIPTDKRIVTIVMMPSPMRTLGTTVHRMHRVEFPRPLKPLWLKHLPTGTPFAVSQICGTFRELARHSRHGSC